MTSFAAADSRDTSAESRVMLWGQAWETMLARPLRGVGPRNWGGLAIARYGWTSDKEAHNTWLQTGAELGFPGLIALLLLFTAPALLLVPMAHGYRATPAEGDLARMVVCGLAGFLVASQFITVYGIEAPYFLAMMGGGLLRIRSSAAAPDVAPARADSHALAVNGSSLISGASSGPMGAVARLR